MAEIIKDGRTGATAKVDANNRLHTQSRTLDIALAETLEGHSYDVSTEGGISLTDDSLSALIYIKNTGDEDLIVETIFVDSISSTGGVGSGFMNWVLNPTGGTLVDAATDCKVINRRIGNPVNLSATAFKASTTGQTLTGGDIIQFPSPAGAGIPFGKPFVIPKGQAFGVNYQPPTGNTSMLMQIGMLIVVDTTTHQ